MPTAPHPAQRSNFPEGASATDLAGQGHLRFLRALVVRSGMTPPTVSLETSAYRSLCIQLGF
jgi:hypothetical protein